MNLIFKFKELRITNVPKGDDDIKKLVEARVRTRNPDALIDEMYEEED